MYLVQACGFFSYCGSAAAARGKRSGGWTLDEGARGLLYVLKYLVSGAQSRPARAVPDDASERETVTASFLFWLLLLTSDSFFVAVPLGYGWKALLHTVSAPDSHAGASSDSTDALSTH